MTVSMRSKGNFPDNAFLESLFATLNGKLFPSLGAEEGRVWAHIFLCMLAYYVEWHLLEAWRPLLFADEDRAAKERSLSLRLGLETSN